MDLDAWFVRLRYMNNLKHGLEELKITTTTWVFKLETWIKDSQTWEFKNLKHGYIWILKRDEWFHIKISW